MKILLIGFGSIGRRHFANLLALGYNDVTVVSRRGVGLEDSGKKIYDSTERALEEGQYHAAFICTPTALHVRDLLLLMKHNVKNIYVEKPLGDSLDQLPKVMEVADESYNIVVGYDLHFDPGMCKLKAIVTERRIGRIVSANAFVGQHLSQWRPTGDHRNGMSAKKELGGGVMFDLIHEVDYLCSLFGTVESVSCHYINTGELEIETEEAADMLLKFANGIIATVHMDYLQPKLKRHCIVTGTAGTICWDLAGQVLTVTTTEGEERFDYSGYTRNERFMDIIKSFLQQPSDSRLTHLCTGVHSLEVILAAKRSSEQHSMLPVKPAV